MAPSSDEIYAQISGILEETLIPDDPIIPGATLLGDLGAESIDFLDGGTAPASDPSASVPVARPP